MLFVTLSPVATQNLGSENPGSDATMSGVMKS
jgi:hypothetical protein